MEMLTEYLAKGFMTMLSISMPCVLVAAAIGLVSDVVDASELSYKLATALDTLASKRVTTLNKKHNNIPL